MDNNEKYELLAQGEVFQPSAMGIVPANKDFRFDFPAIQSALKSNKDFKLKSFEILPKKKGSKSPHYMGNIEYKGETYTVHILISDVGSLRLEDFGLANMVEEDDYRLALSQPYFAEVSMQFKKDPLLSFHLQLKILNAIVPEASLVIDFMSFRLLSAKWLKMTASSDIPPSPVYLYTLHSVYDEKNNRTEYWFHTHGLIRCGSIELEILNVTSGPQQMFDLVNNVVKRFLSDPVKENTKFTVGYDGLDINLTWLRWEEALNDFPSEVLGSIKDRDGDENVHREPSGLLFAVEDKNLISPEIYVSTLANNPVLYISSKETLRMSELAKERYPYLLDLFKEKTASGKNNFWNKIFGKKKETELWSFLVKLGLKVDDANDPTEKEHLWFQLQSADDRSITGKLINQPYWIASLNEGDVKTYPVELLTDWLIYDTEGKQFSPDTIYQLISFS